MTPKEIDLELTGIFASQEVPEGFASWRAYVLCRGRDIQNALRGADLRQLTADLLYKKIIEGQRQASADWLRAREVKGAESAAANTRYEIWHTYHKLYLFLLDRNAVAVDEEAMNPAPASPIVSEAAPASQDWSELERALKVVDTRIDSRGLAIQPAYDIADNAARNAAYKAAPALLAEIKSLRAAAAVSPIDGGALASKSSLVVEALQHLGNGIDRAEATASDAGRASELQTAIENALPLLEAELARPVSLSSEGGGGAGRWVSVDERLPVPGRKVLVLIKPGIEAHDAIEIAYFVQHGKGRVPGHWSSWESLPFADVIGWQELPFALL